MTFSGRWLLESTVLVDGRELDGCRGFWAVTPVAVCAGPATSCDGSEPAMLVVQRLGADPDRPDSAPPRGRVDLTG